MTWLPAAIAALIPLQLISDWIQRQAIVLRFDELTPERPPAIHWGWYLPDSYGAGYSFFRVRLPSWDWQLSDYGRRWCWHQAWLCWASRGAWRPGWAIVWRPEDR